MHYYAVVYSNELYHHGIKGQKWGVRRFRNKDGTLTPEGRKRNSVTSDSKDKTSYKKMYKMMDDKALNKEYDKLVEKQSTLVVRVINSHGVWIGSEPKPGSESELYEVMDRIRAINNEISRRVMAERAK